MENSQRDKRGMAWVSGQDRCLNPRVYVFISVYPRPMPRNSVQQIQMGNVAAAAVVVGSAESNRC